MNIKIIIALILCLSISPQMSDARSIAPAKNIFQTHASGELYSSEFSNTGRVERVGVWKKTGVVKDHVTGFNIQTYSMTMTINGQNYNYRMQQDRYKSNCLNWSFGYAGYPPRAGDAWGSICIRPNNTFGYYEHGRIVEIQPRPPYYQSTEIQYNQVTFYGTAKPTATRWTGTTSPSSFRKFSPRFLYLSHGYNTTSGYQNSKPYTYIVTTAKLEQSGIHIYLADGSGGTFTYTVTQIATGVINTNQVCQILGKGHSFDLRGYGTITCK